MDELTRKFWDKFEKYYGIRFSEAKNRLIHELALQRTQELGLNRVEIYIELFTADKLSDDEYRYWATQLTINETYFFRDEGQWDAIRESVIPEIIKRKSSTKELCALSLGTSTGEEAYTLAMIVDFYFRGLPGWNVRIDATDIKEEVLAKARRGKYGERSIRGIPRELSDRFLTGTSGGYEVREEIRQMVSFFYHNIMDVPYKLPASQYDVILCRNVIIYFSESVAKSVLRNILHLLPVGGFLILGHSENHLTSGLDITPEYLANCVLYRKIKNVRQSHEKDVEPWIGLRKPYSTDGFSHGVISSEERRASTVGIHEYAQSLPDTLVVRAERCIQMHEYSEAKKHLESALHQLPMYTPAHYMLGVLYQILQDEEKAQRQFERVIYLDPNHILGYFQLAMLHQRRGNTQSALKLYRTILLLTQHFDKEYVIDRQTELTIGFVQMICSNFLQQEHSQLWQQEHSRL